MIIKILYMELSLLHSCCFISPSMAVSFTNSILPFTHGSLSHLGRISQPLQRVKLTHRSNSDLHCSSNVAEEYIPIEKRFPSYPIVMDINQLLETLPHRFPFLLVDRIIEYTPGESVVGIKNVTINDNFFPGHFPQRPIMPGVLMIEAMAQVGGAILLRPEVGVSQKLFFFAGVDKVRFRKPVVPGDTLVMRMKAIKIEKRFGVAKLEGRAFVGGDLVCEGEFLMASGSENK